MTLAQLNYFVKVAENGHLTQTAKELLIAQPSLTQAIRKLEEELGFLLFEKKGRALFLTKEGKVYQGCNIENAAYSPSVCAERTAFFKAVYEGERNFKAIAIMGGPETVKGPDCDICAPCGICRQVMMEFCDPGTFEILLGTPEKYEIYTLKEILPLGFGSANLKKK